MKILYIENTAHTFTIVPRILPNLGDILSITMRNELTDEISEIGHNFDYNNNYFTLTITGSTVPNFFQLHNKYEISMLRDSSVIYSGKMVVLSNSESVQDFKLTEITNSKKIKF